MSHTVCVFACADILKSLLCFNPSTALEIIIIKSHVCHIFVPPPTDAECKLMERSNNIWNTTGHLQCLFKVCVQNTFPLHIQLLKFSLDTSHLFMPFLSRFCWPPIKIANKLQKYEVGDQLEQTTSLSLRNKYKLYVKTVFSVFLK